MAALQISPTKKECHGLERHYFPHGPNTVLSLFHCGPWRESVVLPCAVKLRWLTVLPWMWHSEHIPPDFYGQVELLQSLLLLWFEHSCFASNSFLLHEYQIILSVHAVRAVLPRLIEQEMSSTALCAHSGCSLACTFFGVRQMLPVPNRKGNMQAHARTHALMHAHGCLNLDLSCCGPHKGLLSRPLSVFSIV